MLGFERTGSLTLTVALRTFKRHPANAKIMQACWRHSMAAALLAEELTPLFEIAEDRADTAGLMHDVGERRLFQMDHCHAGLLLTQRWGFPSEYSRVAGCHHGEVPTAKAKQDLGVAHAHGLPSR